MLTSATNGVFTPTTTNGSMISEATVVGMSSLTGRLRTLAERRYYRRHLDCLIVLAIGLAGNIHGNRERRLGIIGNRADITGVYVVVGLLAIRHQNL